MELKDIIALANAGFTAQQIAAFAQPVQQPMQPVQPVHQPVQQPVQPVQQPVQPVQPDPIMAELAKLTGAIQANGLMKAQQPSAQTADEVLASIINPPAKGN